MTTVDLHPEFLSANGKRQFAILPYEEFVAVQEFLEDMEDLRDLELARKENEGQPSYTLEEVKKELGIE
ncbi:hypothetical protein BH10ACI2_BH10ACI2_14570 [soil metagenome]